MTADLVAAETTVDTQNPAEVAAWLRRRAHINREFAATPPPQHVLEDWQRNVMPHLAFRFDQIAELVEKLHERNAWLETYVKACDNEIRRARGVLPTVDVPACICGQGDKPAKTHFSGCPVSPLYDPPDTRTAKS